MNNNTNKLRVLMCSEASFLSSGFGTYAKEILSRLHKTGKYVIAEFASYGFVNDPRDTSIDWIYYANAIKEGDPRHKEYSARGDNQFGRWRFEKVLLDFKPDVVIDVRDYWMTAYQAMSPLRPYFHWVLMPTVDSEPQQEEWIETFLSADAIFTYSDWGADVLKAQSSGKINYIDTTSPGVDLDTFKILDRSKVRQKYEIPEDAIIIGSVMRNQKRKLIPELCSSFRKLLDQLEQTDPELGNKLYLYLHTSYPDMGWDIPEILKDNRIANKVLFTYVCRNCRSVSCSTFGGPQRICKNCVNKAAVFPSVADGLTTEQLSEVYNLFDLYVQYAICEGFGMPQVEAGACGIPIATVDYSAMCDIVKKLDAYPIKVKSKFKELETKAYRVYPDNEDLIAYLKEFISLPAPMRNQKRIKVRELTEKNYCWDDIAKKWEKYLDKLNDSGYRSNWNKLIDQIRPFEDANISVPIQQNLDACLVLCNKYFGDLDKMQKLELLNLLKDIDYGFSSSGHMNIKSSSFKSIIDYIHTVLDNQAQTNNVLQNNTTFQDDFIAYAKMKASS